MLNAQGKDTVIYQIRNTVDNKIYVGSALYWKARISTHTGALNTGRHKNSYLQRAWDKYGQNSFAFEVLEILSDRSQENIREREQYWLDTLKPYDRSVGYNILTQAFRSNGLVMSQEGKERRRQAMLAKGKDHHAKTYSYLRRYRQEHGYAVSSEAVKKYYQEHPESRNRFKGYQTGSDNPNAKLNEEQVLVIKQMLKDGAMCKDVAVLYNVTPGAISAINRNERWKSVGEEKCEPRSRWNQRLTKEQVLEIKAMIKDGKPQSAIAAKFEISRSVVAGIAQGHKWKHVGEPCKPKGKSKLTREQVGIIKQMLGEGRSQQSIANEFGVTRPTIGGIARGNSWSDVP
jgi:group I intron endonuclease